MGTLAYFPIMLLPILLAAIAVGIFINGLLLKFSCWIFNHWFASAPLAAEPVAQEPAPIATAMTADEYAASEAEQHTNPFSSPRKAAKPPAVAGGRAQVVSPTIGVSLGLGILLTGLQVVVPMAVEFLMDSLAPLGFRQFPTQWGMTVALLATFVCTSFLVWALLSNNSFRRGLAVTVVYYAVLIAFVSPWIIAAVFFAHTTFEPGF